MTELAKRVAYLREQGFNEDHLRLLVDDKKCQAATAINRKGMESQIKYLLTCLDWKEIVEWCRHEREYFQHHMIKSSSKCCPEQNVGKVKHGRAKDTKKRC